MLYRWDGTYGLDSATQDWYNGVLRRLGYDVVLPGHPGRDQTRLAGVGGPYRRHPGSVSTYLLCGGNPSLPFVYNENTGPSDGCCSARRVRTPAVSARSRRDDRDVAQPPRLGWQSTESSQIVTGWANRKPSGARPYGMIMSNGDASGRRRYS